MTYTEKQIAKKLEKIRQKQGQKKSKPMSKEQFDKLVKAFSSDEVKASFQRIMSNSFTYIAPLLRYIISADGKDDLALLVNFANWLAYLNADEKAGEKAVDESVDAFLKMYDMSEGLTLEYFCGFVKKELDENERVKMLNAIKEIAYISSIQSPKVEIYNQMAKLLLKGK